MRYFRRNCSKVPQYYSAPNPAAVLLRPLQYTLRNGLPEEKLILIRQCVERIVIDKENNTAKLNIYIVPTNNLKEVEEICTNLIC